MRQLGELEAAVMDRLWSWNRSVVVRDVLEDLQLSRSIAYTTVMTVLDNLHRKGYVLREKDGRAYRYRAVRTREEHTADLMDQLLDSTPDRGAALLHFVGRMEADEVSRLRQALHGAASEQEDTGL